MAHSVYWAENGSYRWKDASVAIAKAMKTRGLTKDENVVSVSLAEGAELLIDGDEKYAEAIYASSSIGKSIKARKELGWQPKHGDEEFWARFDVEVERAI
ncbi:MAG: hypothetical protein M1818_001065 [Claussenomyces sp. TS43310]|nr:MAG: hypothetical protein M1818_001065 [Claussenomyces sp. TS43310]